MLNNLHYFHVIYVQAHFPNEPNKLWWTESLRQWLEVRIRTSSIFYRVRLQAQTYNPDEKLS